MADRLTQLQDCLDQLLIQMYASLMYIETHHNWSTIPAQPDHTDQNPNLEAAAAAVDGVQPSTEATQTTQPIQTVQTSTASVNSTSAPSSAVAATQTALSLIPFRPAPTSGPTPAFTSALHELARDLVLKEQQIEHLISVLPGIGTSERDQLRRMAELEGQLREVEEERVEALREKEKLLERVEDVIGGLRIV